MSDSKQRQARQEFSCRVRLAVSGREDAERTLAENLSPGGMFIRHDRPPLPGSEVLVEVMLPDGSCLCRIAGKVAHARRATVDGERTAGMGIEFVELDEVAQELFRKLERPTEIIPETPPVTGRESLLPPERTPFIQLDGPVVGINLGTATSSVAYMQGERPMVLSSGAGYQLLPSVVFIAKDGGVSVGHRAVERMILEPERAIYGSKRFLGRPFASREVKGLGHFFNYALVAGEDGRVAAKIGETVMTLETVAAHILSTLRQIAEDSLGKSVRRAVITVPAYFGETQRQAVRDAGRLAGLYVERILNEPTAAAVAYGWGRDSLGTVLVYDLGGGTFDVALLRVDGERVEVLGADGDPFLGGIDFDDRLTAYMLHCFERETRQSLSKDPVAVQRVRFAAELAKRQLSEMQSTEVHLPYICTGKLGPLDLRQRLTRDIFETLTTDLVNRTFGLVQRVLDSASIQSSHLEDVILVGGQTRSPLVRRRLAERFGRRPSVSVHPDEAVALGAAIIAQALEKKRGLELVDLLPGSIRLVLPDGLTRVLVKRGARLPAVVDPSIAPDAAGDYNVRLCRGEALVAEENTPLGLARLAGSPALAVAGTEAKARVQLDAQGILSVSLTHPISGQESQNAMAL